jgi:class 3 adenylate cyclase
VLVTRAVVDQIGSSGYLDFEPIGPVDLRGFPQKEELFLVRPQEPDA